MTGGRFTHRGAFDVCSGTLYVLGGLDLCRYLYNYNLSNACLFRLSADRLRRAMGRTVVDTVSAPTKSRAVPAGSVKKSVVTLRQLLVEVW